MAKNRMNRFTGITNDPAIMGEEPCIRGLRMTVDTMVGLLAAGRSREEILSAYPYLEFDDLDETLAYAERQDRCEQKQVLDYSIMQANKVAKEDPY